MNRTQMPRDARHALHHMHAWRPTPCWSPSSAPPYTTCMHGARHPWLYGFGFTRLELAAEGHRRDKTRGEGPQTLAAKVKGKPVLLSGIRVHQPPVQSFGAQPALAHRRPCRQPHPRPTLLPRGRSAGAAVARVGTVCIAIAPPRSTHVVAAARLRRRACSPR